MGAFFDHPPCKLIVGRQGDYAHWFGGAPAHRGVIPQGRTHQVHLLYDLDLRDPALGLASRFEGLSRLPLYNALQYNCCDMVYRVVADDAIEIIVMTNPNDPDWDADHPFPNYPNAFERLPVAVEPIGPLRAREDPFPQIGGQQSMWQGAPIWDCRSCGCTFAGKSTDAGKEVFAVIWERPAPGVHLWSDDPDDQDVGSIQIIFSRCTGCGVVHSCNRCD